MNYYGSLRAADRRPPTPTAEGRYLERRRRREAEAGGAGPPTLGAVADHEALIAAYRGLEAKGGPSPGPDGVEFHNLGRREVAILAREAAKAIRRGDYRPGPTRKVAIPKGGGSTRILSVGNIADRVVGAALAAALTPTFERTFSARSHGFRPGRGTWGLLADLEATLASEPSTILAIDDVKRAFDNVPIAYLLEAISEHVHDSGLLRLVEEVSRGGEDRHRASGIAQGCPLSPLALNVVLHRLHDAPLGADTVGTPPWYRYADNLAYLCSGVPEGHEVLDRVRGLLAAAGLQLKGADGPPVDLRAGEAQLLGFRLTLRGDRLRLRLGEGAWDRLALALIEAHEGPDPPRTARAVARGWIESHGPAFESGPEIARAVERLMRDGAMQGFRGSFGTTDQLRGSCADAFVRWEVARGAHSHRAKTSRHPSGSVAATPPAAIVTGV